MNGEEAAKELENIKLFYADLDKRKALDMAIELLNEKNPQCKGCGYNTHFKDNGCEAFTQRPEHCTNYTTRKQKTARTALIDSYHGNYNRRGK